MGKSHRQVVQWPLYWRAQALLRGPGEGAGAMALLISKK
jgi:hypothetical protein